MFIRGLHETLHMLSTPVNMGVVFSLLMHTSSSVVMLQCLYIPPQLSHRHACYITLCTVLQPVDNTSKIRPARRK